MKTKTRFLKSVITSAQKQQIEMPWARGTARAALIASRRAALMAQPVRRTA